MKPGDELIQRAKQADLLAVAHDLNLPLKREGKYWRIPGHSGLMIYRKNGYWIWCQMGEERGGDAISFLTESPVGQMGFKQAVEFLTGESWPGSTQDSRHSSLKPNHNHHNPRHDESLWRKKALAFCKWSHEKLMASKGARMRLWLLENRGLHENSVIRFRLGWNPQQHFRSKRDWGIDEDGKLALPAGLIIPRLDSNGRLTGITIRRTDQAEAKQFGRYYSIPSPRGREIWALRQEPLSDDSRTQKDDGWPLVIVEGELDALLLVQETDCVNLAALGSAGRKPQDLKRHKDFLELFVRAPAVFVALDNDEAGRKATEWWLETWKHTQPLYLPKGFKDPTEAFLAGIDLKQLLFDACEAANIRGYPLFSLSVDSIQKQLKISKEE